jgi:rsbT antagonist protein RsbS
VHDTKDEFFISLMKLGTCLFVSIPERLRDSQARSLQDAVSHRLSIEKKIAGLVIDVSALALVDSYAAKILGETAAIAHSFGSKAVLVGIRPAVAITLVELGIDLANVETAMTLEQALRKLKLRIVSVE